MKSSHTPSHRGGENCWEPGDTRGMCVNCPVGAVPKGAGAGAPAEKPEAAGEGGREGRKEGRPFLQRKASCRGTLQSLRWPQDVSQMQKHGLGRRSSGTCSEKRSRHHLLRAEQRFHTGYRCHRLPGQLRVTVKSIGVTMHHKIPREVACFSG